VFGRTIVIETTILARRTPHQKLDQPIAYGIEE